MIVQDLPCERGIPDRDRTHGNRHMSCSCVGKWGNQKAGVSYSILDFKRAAWLQGAREIEYAFCNAVTHPLSSKQPRSHWNDSALVISITPDYSARGFLMMITFTGSSAQSQFDEQWCRCPKIRNSEFSCTKQYKRIQNWGTCRTVEAINNKYAWRPWSIPGVTYGKQ